MSRLHSDELDVDAALVRRLVDAAFPAFRAGELQPLAASGSSILDTLSMMVRASARSSSGAFQSNDAIVAPWSSIVTFDWVLTS